MRLPAGIRAIAVALPLSLSALGGAWAASPVDGLGANSWMNVSPNPTERCTSSQDSCTTRETTSGPRWRAYSGIAAGGGKVLYFGGGHCTYQGNDVEIYDVAANAWLQSYTPEYRLCGGGTGCNGVAYGSDGGWGIKELSPQCRPQTQHVYQYFEYEPVLRKFVGALAPGTWSYDPATATWSALAGDYASSKFSPSTGTGSGLLIYDTSSSALFLFSLTSADRGTYRFDRSNNSWTRVANVPDAIGMEIYGVYIPGRRVFMISAVNFYNGNAPAFWEFSPPTNTWTNVTSKTPAALLHVGADADRGTSCITYDSTNDVVLALSPEGGSQAVWAYRPSSDSWSKMPAPAVTPPTSLCQWGDFRYEASSNAAFLVISGNTAATWAYRYQPSGPPPPLPSPPTNLRPRN